MSNKYENDECPSFINMMNVHHLWIWWMSIIQDVCTSCIMDGTHIWWMSIIFEVLFINDVSPSHVCIHICERPSWWNQWNFLIGGINGKYMVDFAVIMELMESEDRWMDSLELLRIMELVKVSHWNWINEMDRLVLTESLILVELMAWKQCICSVLLTRSDEANRINWTDGIL